MAGIIIRRNNQGLLDLQSTFAQQIDYLLKKKNYTAKKLCAETGTSENTLSLFRSGKRAMTTRTLETLLNHLLIQEDAN